MPSEDFDRGTPHEYAVEFLTADELRELDTDPVLERADFWERGRP